MKSLRLLLALAVVSAFAATSLRAGDDADQAKQKTEEACHCEKDKDGKVCGKDKECCCKAGDHEKAETKKDKK